MFATNLRAPFLLSQGVAREMVKTGGGAIVHIASIDASGGDGPYASYNASKAGLLGLNRTMALELARHGIRVNCVSPGLHPHRHDRGGGAARAHGLPAEPVRPCARCAGSSSPEEIAAACAYLASDDASASPGST